MSEYFVTPTGIISEPAEKAGLIPESNEYIRLTDLTICNMINRYMLLVAQRESEYLEVVQRMREEGYAVVYLSPDEVGTANPNLVEDRLHEISSDIVAALQ